MSLKPLEHELCDIFHKHGLLRTPREQPIHCFDKTTSIDIPDDDFARNVDGMLRTFLLHLPDSKDMKALYVRCEQHDLDACFSENVSKVNEKWMSYQDAHEALDYEEHMADQHNYFACDSVCLHLWAIMLAQLSAIGGHNYVVNDEAQLKSKAKTALLKMPRSPECSRMQKTGELYVT